MRARNFLIAVLALMTMFTNGCSLMDLFAGMGMQPPVGPLGQAPQLPPGLGQGPLDGSLNGGLPPFNPGPIAAAPGATPQVPASGPGTAAPSSPQNTPVPNPGTPAGITPPAPSIPSSVAAGTPSATPVGAGPIRPLAASNPTADVIAMTPPVLPPPGL